MTIRHGTLRVSAVKKIAGLTRGEGVKTPAVEARANLTTFVRVTLSGQAGATL